MAKNNNRKKSSLKRPVAAKPAAKNAAAKKPVAKKSAGGLTRQQAGPSGPRVYNTRTPPKEWTRPRNGVSKPKTTRPVVTPPKPPVVDPPVVRVVRRGLVTANRLALAGQLGSKSPPAKKAAEISQRKKASPDHPVKKKAVRKAEPKPAKTHRPERSPETVRDEKMTCKARPKDNRPRKGGGGGGKRFIPWCS